MTQPPTVPSEPGWYLADNFADSRLGLVNSIPMLLHDGHWYKRGFKALGPRGVSDFINFRRLIEAPAKKPIERLQPMPYVIDDEAPEQPVECELRPTGVGLWRDRDSGKVGWIWGGAILNYQEIDVVTGLPTAKNCHIDELHTGHWQRATFTGEAERGSTACEKNLLDDIASSLHDWPEGSRNAYVPAQFPAMITSLRQQLATFPAWKEQVRQALGDHPDMNLESDIGERISAIRDEGRRCFDELARVKQERDAAGKEAERLNEIIYQACQHTMPGLELTATAADELPLSCKRLVKSEHNFQQHYDRVKAELDRLRKPMTNERLLALAAKYPAPHNRPEEDLFAAHPSESDVSKPGKIYTSAASGDAVCPNHTAPLAASQPADEIYKPNFLTPKDAEFLKAMEGPAQPAASVADSVEHLVRKINHLASEDMGRVFGMQADKKLAELLRPFVGSLTPPTPITYSGQELEPGVWYEEISEEGWALLVWPDQRIGFRNGRRYIRVVAVPSFEGEGKS